MFGTKAKCFEAIQAWGVRYGQTVVVIMPSPTYHTELLASLHRFGVGVSEGWDVHRLNPTLELTVKPGR